MTELAPVSTSCLGNVGGRKGGQGAGAPSQDVQVGSHTEEGSKGQIGHREPSHRDHCEPPKKTG